MKRLSCIFAIVVALGITGHGASVAIFTSAPAPTVPLTVSTTSTPTTPSSSPSPIPTPPSASEIAKSSVRIDAYVEKEGKSVLAGHGSGTLLTTEGLILTNAHVIYGADELVIALTSHAALPPTPSYYAEPVAVDYVLDLALVQITTDLDGNEVAQTQINLPALGLGDSDDISLGQRIRIFGYPGYGSETVTYTEGTVGGFVSEDLGGGLEPVWLKTDTDISFGNSGGTAVNERGLLVGVPTAGRGSGMETLGYLRPVNLPKKYLIEGSCPPLICDARIYEPNNNLFMAYGPLESKVSYTAYIHEDDADFYSIQVQSLKPIEIDLTNIADDVDYDLALLDFYHDDARLLVLSDGADTSSERIVYSPAYTGTYYVGVGPYKGYSLKEPYVLQVAFDGDAAELGNVTVRGRVLDANTDRPIEGGVMFLLRPGVTGEQFIASSSDPELVQSSSITDSNGIFVLEQVPRGNSYTGFITIQTDSFWENGWLTIVSGDPDDIDLGDIRVASE